MATGVETNRQRQLVGLGILLSVITIILTIKLGQSSGEHSAPAEGGTGTEPPQSFPCKFCSQSFSTPFETAFHMKWEHGFWA